MDDSELINDFTRTRSESAFRELVHRHVNLVYAAARRQVRDPALAEDVTQGVFIILARKAKTIRNAAALSGWLLSTTRHVAATANRARSRRTEHETEAAAMQSQEESSAPQQAWMEMEPEIDAAMASLPKLDRNILALRYFQSKSLTEVGAAVGVSEEAARKRVDRALAKLRTFLTGRGMTMSVATVAAGIAVAPHAPSAPAALAATISSSALTASTAATTAGLSFANAAMKTMFWLKLKLAALIIAACLVPITVAAVALPHAPATRTTTAPVYTFHGRLVDGKGAPVPGAVVAMNAEKGNAQQQRKATSDADGKFALTNSLTSKFLMDVTKPGYRQIMYQELESSDAPQTIKFLHNLTVAGNVTDAQTHRPIANFSAMTGGAWNAANRWLNSDRAIASTNGRYSINIDWWCTEVWIHVEAPGYLPADSRIFTTEEGSATADIELKPAANIVVKVLLPDGSPAAGATIYVGSGSDTVYINDELPKEIKGPTSQRSTPRLTASADGTFTLTPQIGRFQLVAVHERGFGEVLGDAAHAPSTIQLAPWSNVHGTVAASVRNGKSQQVSAFMQNPGRLQYMDAKNIGADGAFNFDHVPPGDLQISLPVPFERGRTGITVPDHLNVLTITSGQTIETKIGGSGVIVIGKAALPTAIKGDLASRFVYGQLTSRPMLREFVRPTTAEIKAMFDRRIEAKSFAVRINADGTFTIKDVPTGSYHLNIEVLEINEGPSWGEGPEVAQAYKSIEITNTADRCDLGLITLQPPQHANP